MAYLVWWPGCIWWGLNYVVHRLRQWNKSLSPLQTSHYLSLGPVSEWFFIEMEAIYKRAAGLRNLIQDVYISGFIDAHWIADSPYFWYRQELTRESFTFSLVNAETRKIEPAFNHQALVGELSKYNIEASVDKLPFREIEINNDIKSIRFYVDDTSYEYDFLNNILSSPNAGVSGSGNESLEPLVEEEPSVLSQPTRKCSLVFNNKRNRAIRIWWINYEGEPELPSTADAGNSSRRQTYYGHVWRVCDDATGEVIANYVAPNRTIAHVAIENDTTPPVKDTTPDLDTPRCVVKDFNVHIISKGSDAQVSSTGSEVNPFDPDHIYHSPDRTHAIIWQFTPEQKRVLHRIESTPNDQLQPRLTEKQYLKPGDKIRIDRPRLFNMQQKQEITTSDLLFHNPYRIEYVGWNQTSTKYRFIYNERGHKVLRVIELDLAGCARILVEEKFDTFVDYAHNVLWQFEKTTDELLWTSERDGSNHLYLIKLDSPADLENRPTPLQLTHGSGNIRSIEHVDTKARQVYVTMLGATPGQDTYYKQLVRVSMDKSTSDASSNFKILTPLNVSKWTFSSDFQYFVAELSQVNTPPQTHLYFNDGTHILHIDTASIASLTALTPHLPESLAFPGRDGITPIYGTLIKPSHFNPDKTYPIIQEIYSGPQNFYVPKSFAKLPNHHALAELGFIVVKIDGMGTNWRSKAFHDKCYKNLRDAGLPDHIAWIKAAAATRPWMDTSRVGIYGMSAGGQNALAALLWHGDFYSAAIADCGCHDNRLDKLWWNELYMGWPVDEAYEENSNVVHAGRLQGRLMLVVGEMDGNVDPASTMQVARKLDLAGKDYELWVVPGGGHGSGRSGVMRRRMWDFWVRHLKGEEPPKWNDAGVRERMGEFFNAG